MFTCEMAGCDDMAVCDAVFKDSKVLECCEYHGVFWRDSLQIEAIKFWLDSGQNSG